MATPSVRLLTGAVWALLDGHAQLQVFQSFVEDPELDPETEQLAKGYAVFHPGGGNDQPNNLAVSPGQLLWAFQVSCVGKDHEQVGWVVDTVRGLLTGQTLTVAGHSVGRMQPPLGYQAPPPRPDITDSTERLQIPLQYVVLAVA